MQRKRKFAAIITKGEVAFVSYCPELGIASQGKTSEDAKKNLKEAIELYLEEAEHSHIAKIHQPIMTSIDVRTRHGL